MRRREFVRMLGIGAWAGLSALLAACRGAPAPTPTAAATPAGAATPTPGVSPTTAVASTPVARAGAVTITWSVQSFAHQALQPFLDEFNKLTGITVRLESGPATGQDLMTQLIPAFSSGTTPFDVIDVDDPASEAFIAAGWLEPLDDALEPNFWDDFPPSMIDATKTWNQSGGETFRIYHNWELGYFWYRKDILDELGLSVPKTWDDLVNVGKEAKARKQMWGFADAAAKPGLTFVYLAYIVAQAGGNLYDFDEGTRRGFEFAHELLYTYQIFPQDALTWSYDQLNNAYMQDQLLTMREWTFFWDVAKANTQWYSPEKVSITVPPAGPGGSRTWAGGWGWAIPRFTKNKDAAKEFIRYITSREIAPRLARASSFFVTSRNSVMSEVGSEGITQYMRLYTEQGVVAPRPYHKQAAKAESIIDDIGQAYLTNQIDLDQAMALGRQRVAMLT